ncbi:SWR1 complex bromodomain subunit bdf1 [Smittium mucronatum]|uniref:SWR1 complex bromodomain subunit bdf1 n=1 Tax=Smittium mucronatum TaxID=133383 RepID=A0A1R0H326_9FUNG|nr:SWR1 complex bromodomain subunit bdf1 [Smittium mucronatum]
MATKDMLFANEIIPKKQLDGLDKDDESHDLSMNQEEMESEDAFDIPSTELEKIDRLKDLNPFTSPIKRDYTVVDKNTDISPESYTPTSNENEPISLLQLTVASKMDLDDDDSSIDFEKLPENNKQLNPIKYESSTANSSERSVPDDVSSISLDMLKNLTSTPPELDLTTSNNNMDSNHVDSILSHTNNIVEPSSETSIVKSLDAGLPLVSHPSLKLESLDSHLVSTKSENPPVSIPQESYSELSDSISFPKNSDLNSVNVSDRISDVTGVSITSDSISIKKEILTSNNQEFVSIDTSKDSLNIPDNLSLTQNKPLIQNKTVDEFQNPPSMENLNSEYVKLSDYSIGDKNPPLELKKPIVPSKKSKSKLQMPKDQLRYCLAMIRSLKKHGDAGPFLKPVDIVLLNIPDYPSVVKEPMDLSTVESNLKSGIYTSSVDFISDMDKIFSNCYLYNGRELPVSLMAMNLEKAYRNQLKKMPDSSNPTPNRYSNSAPAPIQAPTPTQPQTLNKPRSRRETHPPPSRDIPTPSLNPKRSNSRLLDPQLKFCAGLIREFFKKSYYDIACYFYEPVDWVAQGIPDYPTVVEHPMDMGTIRDKLQENDYKNASEFKDDFLLMLNNCYLYNHPKNVVYLAGKALEDSFEKKWKLLPPILSDSPSPTPTPRPKTKRSGRQSSPNQAKFEDSDSDEVLETPSSARIMSLERHVQQVTKELEDLKRIERLKRQEDLKRRAESRSSSNKGKEKKSRKSLATPKAQNSSAFDTPSRGRGSGRKRGGRGGRGGKASSNSRSAKNSSYVTELTLSQKREFSSKIESLPAERLQVALNIIRSACPDLVEEEDEIELDIESLDPYTLKRLYDYVVLCVDLDSEIQAQNPEYYNHTDQLEEKFRAFDSENAPVADVVHGTSLTSHNYSSSSDSDSAESHSDDSEERSS